MGLWSRQRLGLIMHYQKFFQVCSINNDKLNFVWLGVGHNVFWKKAIHNVLILPKYYQTGQSECGLEWAKIFHIVATKNEYFYKIGLYYLVKIKIKTRTGVQYCNRLIWFSFLDSGCTPRPKRFPSLLLEGFSLLVLGFLWPRIPGGFLDLRLEHQNPEGRNCQIFPSQ